DRLSAPEFSRLIELEEQRPPLSMLFSAADDAAWARLVDSAAKTMAVKLLASGTEVPEAYDNLKFKLLSGNRDLELTDLFQHGLQYEWHFTLEYQSRHWPIFWRKEKAELLLSPVSSEPQVVQFAPRAGRWSSNVALVRGSNRIDGPSAPVTIAKSRDDYMWKCFELARWVGM